MLSSARSNNRGSVGGRSGWQSIPIVVDGADGAPAAIAPAYAKSHSQGEYVFDHAWADAWERAGGSYYPKLQLAAPFSPVPGPRLLLRDPAAAPALIAAVEAVTDQHNLSSAHATFVAPDQLPLFEAAGWLVREGTQFHWQNDDYADFDAFLGVLASRKRKAIRKERAAAVAGLEIVHLTGEDIRPQHWAAFWVFYQDTGSRKWGQPYLTRSFFPLLGEALGDKVLLILALRDGVPIAGALNLIGGGYAVRAVLGLYRGRALSAFRIMLLSGDRCRDRGAGSPASRRGRRANTSWRAAMSRCRPGPRIIFPIRVFAARLPTSSSANARASRRTRAIWPS